MEVPRLAVRSRGTAFFVALALVVAVSSRSGAQTASRGVLEQLVQSAAESTRDRYALPLGRVGERRRDRVFTILRQLPPPPGTILEVVRPGKAKHPEHVVARIEVLHTEAGLTECREQERIGRAHAEAGDLVRRPLGATRVLLAPCVALLDIASEIPEVLGERLRGELRASNVLDVVDDPELERRAQAAYSAGIAAGFVARQANVDEVLFPVLLQTPGKMVLNLEYYSVERGRVTDIDVVSAPLDDLMRAWLRAGRTRQSAPPGFRRLPALSFPWRVTGLGEAPGGELVAVDSDSVHVLHVDYPGLRPRWAASLGPRQRPRREAWSIVLPARELQAAGADLGLGDGVHLLSDERRPLFLAWPRSGGQPQLRPAPAELEPALERLWAGLRPQGRRSDTRWWPAVGQAPSVFVPCLADVDQDGKSDLTWTDAGGMLQIKLATQRNARSFPGFGDVKAVQTLLVAGARPTFWLTDPVWHGEPDRLHRAELAGDDLQLAWSSDPYEGTIPALASLDLNADGVADLVVAEAIEEGTRLHVFLAIGSDRSARSGASESGGRR